MNTAKERISALAAVVPNDIIALLKAHLSAKNTSNEVFALYKEAFAADADADGASLYNSDGCSKHLEEVEDKLWHGACLALENWIYETFYDEK